MGREQRRRRDQNNDYSNEGNKEVKRMNSETFGCLSIANKNGSHTIFVTYTGGVITVMAILRSHKTMNIKTTHRA